MELSPLLVVILYVHRSVCGVLEKESQGLFCFRTKEVWQIIRTFALNLGINQNLIVLCRI